MLRNGLYSILFVLGLVMPSTYIVADEAENQLIAIFLGRFASYVELPPSSHEHFIITVLGENPFDNILTETYRSKKIKDKTVLIQHAPSLEELASLPKSDLVYITLPSFRKRQQAIHYAQEQRILSISDKLGFAENGGIIQINFVAQKATIKINYDAAVNSQVRISAPLLSIATVLEDRP